MPKKTSMTIEESSLYAINSFQADLVKQIGGKRINRTQIINILIEGFKNPDFDINDYLKVKESSINA